MSYHPMIIDRPDLQSKAERYGWGSITLAFWVLYVYLWLPLLTIAAWWVGVKLFHYHMIELHGYSGLIEKLGIYSVIIFVISTILIGWAEINRMRFKNKLRRMDNSEVTIDQIAAKYNLPAHKLAELRQKKSMTVYFSDHGAISDIREYELTRS
jgi:biofilm PGA synthesis protein PgaD